MASAFIKSLPDEVKVWFAKAVAGIIMADGKIESHEMYYLEGTIMFLGDEEEMAKIVQMVKTHQMPKLATIRCDRKTATRIFFELVKLAFTDENLSKKEAEFFKYVGRKLGFESFFINCLLEWGKEYIIVEKKRRSLEKHGENTIPKYYA